LAYLGTKPIGGIITSEFFSGDGVELDFPLSFTYGNEASVLVFISGVRQSTTTYALYNGQLSFSEAPAEGTNNIEVVYLSSGTILTNVNNFVSGNFSAEVVGGNLVFSHNGTAIMSLDSSGNLTVTGNVIAGGTIS
jgi:hypothetical protein